MDSPGIWLTDTGQNLNQRGLAGAVLAKQSVDLASPNVKIHAVERERSGEALGQAGDVEKRSGDWLA
jgi:hypothetical protein